MKFVLLSLINIFENDEYDRLCRNVWQARDEYDEICRMVDGGSLSILRVQVANSYKVLVNQSNALARYLQLMHVKYMHAVNDNKHGGI
jgi:hypothetical protein